MPRTQIAAPYPIFTDTDGTPLNDGYLYIGEVSKNPETNPIAVYWDPDFKFPAAQPIRTSNGYPWRMGTPALLYADSQFSITVRNKKRDLVLYAPVGFGINPQAVGGSVIKDDFVGDGSTQGYELSASPSTKLATNVFINGAYQEKDTYSILNNILTFAEAPPLNASIEIITSETGVINSTSANLVSYQAAGAGSVETDVQSKLREIPSINDFGASTSLANNASFVQAALDSTGAVFVPLGVYDCDGNVTVANNGKLYGPGTLNFKSGKLVVSNNSVVDGLTVSGNANTNNEDGISGANKYGWIVRNCTIKDIEYNGIQCAGASYFLVEGCSINNTGTPAGAILPSNSYLGHGIHIPGARRGTIRNNQISASHGQAGIFIDSSDTITVSGNYIHDTFWAGIRGYDTSNACTKIVIDSNRLELIGSLNTTGSVVGCNGIANFSSYTSPTGYDVWDWVVTNNYLEYIEENGIEGAGYVANNTIYKTNNSGLAVVSPEGIYTQGPAKIINNSVYFCGPGIRVYRDGTEVAGDKGLVEISGNSIADPTNGWGIQVTSVNAAGSIDGLVVKDNRLHNGGINLQASSGAAYTYSYVMNNIVTGSLGNPSTIDPSVKSVFGNSFSPMFASGAGSPEGVVTAVVGSVWTRTDGGAGTTLYVKQSGTGNTGWVAK